MLQQKTSSLIILLLLVLTINSHTVFSDQINARDTSNFFEINENTQTLDLTQTPNAEGTGSDLDVDLSNGGGEANGDVKAEDGRLTADQYSGDEGSEFENVNSLSYNDDGDILAVSADYFGYRGFEGWGINSIYASDNIISIGSADRIVYNGLELEDTNIFYVDDEVLAVGETGSIEGHSLELTNLDSATVYFNPDNSLDRINLASNATDNVFDLGQAQIILDSGERATVDFESGSMKINTEYPAEIIADQETVITLTELTDLAWNLSTPENRSEYVEAAGNNQVVIDSEWGVVAVHLAETGRYISFLDDTDAKPFSIYAPPDNSFSFYLKKYSQQNDLPGNCSQCGQIDFTDNTMTLRGIVEYERIADDGEFVDIIETMTFDSVVQFSMDDNLNAIHDVWYQGTGAHFYSGVFEVMVEDTHDYYAYSYLLFAVPYVIENLHTQNNQDVIFNSAEGYMKFSPFDKPVFMYEKNKVADRRYKEKLNNLHNEAINLVAAINKIKEACLSFVND